MVLHICFDIGWRLDDDNLSDKVFLMADLLFAVCDTDIGTTPRR